MDRLRHHVCATPLGVAGLENIDYDRIDCRREAQCSVTVADSGRPADVAGGSKACGERLVGRGFGGGGGGGHRATASSCGGLIFASGVVFSLSVLVSCGPDPRISLSHFLEIQEASRVVVVPAELDLSVWRPAE